MTVSPTALFEPRGHPPWAIVSLVRPLRVHRPGDDPTAVEASNSGGPVPDGQFGAFGNRASCGGSGV